MPSPVPKRTAVLRIRKLPPLRGARQRAGTDTHKPCISYREIHGYPGLCRRHKGNDPPKRRKKVLSFLLDYREKK